MQSVNLLIDLIKEEQKHVKLENIIIGGFSQGCIVSLATALHLKDKLEGPIGGIMGLSGICPIKARGEQEMLKKIPMFIYIGSKDSFFDQKVAELTFKVFEGCNLKYTCEPGLEHSLSQKEMKEIHAFLTEIFSNP